MAKKKKEKRKNLTTQWTNIYVTISLVFVLGFAFFLSSKIFIADEVDVLYTEVGKEFKLNNSGKYTIKEWVYDKENSQMQVTLVTSGLTDYLSDLNFKAVSRINLSKELPTEISYSSNDIYIVKINEVPNNFQQVALRLVKNEIDIENLFEEDVNNKTADELITSIYTDEKVVAHKEILRGNVDDYAIQITDEMITETSNLITENEKEIEKNMIVIEKINEEISQLKSELIYQTVEEQTETTNEIFGLEKEIEKHNKEIEKINVTIDSRNAKVERLIQRKRDLQY